MYYRYGCCVYVCSNVASTTTSSAAPRQQILVCPHRLETSKCRRAIENHLKLLKLARWIFSCRSVFLLSSTVLQVGQIELVLKHNAQQQEEQQQPQSGVDTSPRNNYCWQACLFLLGKTSCRYGYTVVPYACVLLVAYAVSCLKGEGLLRVSCSVVLLGVSVASDPDGE